MADHLRPIRRPSRADVIRIATEEAHKAGADPEAVMGLNRAEGFDRGAANIAARHRALARIVRETGCSRYGLALVWGCDRKAIRWALERSVHTRGAAAVGEDRRAA